MSVLRGDCVEVMAGMDPDSVDAIVCDPPYGIGFMGKEWDGPAIAQAARQDRETRRSLGPHSDSRPGRAAPRSSSAFGSAAHYAGPVTAGLPFQQWCETWAAAALRVAKPGAYLLAFGGTRTVHRMTCALEDAGWVIRDMLVWAYAQGFPKSRASLKPAWEPIVLCRKPGASRDLNIDAARIAAPENVGVTWTRGGNQKGSSLTTNTSGEHQYVEANPAGRWPANVVLTDPIFDGGWEGVVGGGWQDSGAQHRLRDNGSRALGFAHGASERETYPDTEGTYSRFFLIPKAPTRERVLSDGRRSPHPTQKPEALIRHLVTLVTPPGGLVLDPFLGSGTLGVVCEGLGVRWVGIEREPEYADWAEERVRDGKPEWAA